MTTGWIFVNSVPYQLDARKTAVLLSEESLQGNPPLLFRANLRRASYGATCGFGEQTWPCPQRQR